MSFRSITSLAAMTLLLAVLLPLPPASASPPGSKTVTARIDGLPAAPAVARHTAVRLSAPVAAPVPFSLVGFDLPAGAAVEFRTSQDGVAWTRWTEAHVNPDEGPDGAVKTTTEPTWVGAARWVQARAVGAATEDLDVHLVDSAGLGRSWARRAVDAVAAAWRGAPHAEAIVDRPAIVSRAEWGADESLRSDEPSYASRVRFGVLHHTAGSNDYSVAEAPAVVRAIYAYHTRSNGWSDIGYHLLVDRFGTVYEGRAGGIEEPVIGAHAGGFNTGSFGVALIGSFDAVAPPQPAVDALARVLAWKFDVHHLDVAGAHEATSRGSSRYPEGQTVRLATLSGHTDVSATACPGRALYALLPTLRQRMLQLAGDVLLDHAARPQRVRVAEGIAIDGPVELSARLRPPGAWQLEVRNPAGLVVHRDGGEGAEARSTWTPVPVLDRGTYTYEFSSVGRRSASDDIELNAPVIEPLVTPQAAVADQNGALAEPVRFTAELWPDAAWKVTVTDAAGAYVFSAEGVGERLDAQWSGPAASAGTYRWRIEADDAEPVTGSVEVAVELLERVGGGQDTTAAAVGVSRAAFPDAGSARHAVLARADVFADAMAGGPLAAGEGPVLLTPGGSLAAGVHTELTRVLPAGAPVYVLGGPAAVSESVTDALAERWEVTRLAGPGRVETAAAIAEVVVARTGADRVLIARAGPDHAAPWADALAGGAWGAHEGVPVLLTDTATLSPATLRALDRLGITSTVVLGGPAAVSDAAVAQLPAPRRVSGQDRAATAAAIAGQLWGRSAGGDGDRIVLAAGYAPTAWALPLAAAPLAARRDAPLLLADRDVLPGATRDYLQALRYGDGRTGAGWVLGDEASVAEAVADEVSTLLQ